MNNSFSKATIKGIIFDMDGTMIDNMMVHHRAWKRKLADYGLEMTLEEVKEKVHGINEEILLRLFGDRFTTEERRKISAEKEAEYRRIFLPELKLIPGLIEFLNKLNQAGIPMAIGTAAPPENANFVLNNLPIKHFFKAIWHSRSVENGKPHPEIYLKSADSLGLRPEECIVFEDSTTGAEAAQRAGCPCVVVTTTHTAEEFSHFPHVIRFINDFTEIVPEDILDFK